MQLGIPLTFQVKVDVKIRTQVDLSKVLLMLFLPVKLEQNTTELTNATDGYSELEGPSNITK